VQNVPPMWHLLKLAMTFLRCLPAFFRNRRQQALVELALRQQLATYTQESQAPDLPAGPGLLGTSVSDLVGVEGDPRHRPTRHCRPLA